MVIANHNKKLSETNGQNSHQIMLDEQRNMISYFENILKTQTNIYNLMLQQNQQNSTGSLFNN